MLEQSNSKALKENTTLTKLDISFYDKDMQDKLKENKRAQIAAEQFITIKLLQSNPQESKLPILPGRIAEILAKNTTEKILKDYVSYNDRYYINNNTTWEGEDYDLYH